MTQVYMGFKPPVIWVPESEFYNIPEETDLYIHTHHGYVYRFMDFKQQWWLTVVDCHKQTVHWQKIIIVNRT